MGTRPRDCSARRTRPDRRARSRRRPYLLPMAERCECRVLLSSVTINIDATANRHAINQNVYGVAYGSTAELTDLNVPLNRYGGNNASRYNWQVNADNRDNDYFFESIGDPSSTPGERGDTFIATSKAGGAQPMVTIPTLGWVAKLGPNRSKLASFSVAKYGAQQSTDPFMPDAGNGIQTNGQPVTGNDPNDADVPADANFEKAWVQHIVGKFGTADQGGLHYYILDNEPSIWFSTHRDVHPVGPTMDEILSKILTYSAMIKSVDPNATIVGPEEWGWSGYFYSGFDQQYGAQHGWSNLPDRTAHGGMDYLPWLLDQLHKADLQSGQRSLDVFTVHFYPQAGEFSNDDSPAMQALRNRSTRALWDPNYVNESWINDKVDLIPRLKQWVATYDPGLQVGLTEYNWGDEAHINGATTQADLLGIFGREGLDLAARWTTPDPSTPTYKAIKLYRNYDGHDSSFGDTSVAATVPNPDTLSAFASQRSSDGAMTVMVINKDASSSSTVTLNLAHVNLAGSAQVWQLTSANSIAHLADVATNGGSLITTVPAQSITLFVIPTIPAITAQGASITATEGVALAPSTTIATFTGAGAAADYTATIDWGDGTNSPGAVASDGHGGFVVTSGHTYAEEGSFTVTTTIHNSVTSASATPQGTAHVADAPLSATAVNFSATAGTVFLGVVATFTDANPAGVVSDFTATIDWGDGTSSAGSIVAVTGGFQVSGTHTYATAGSRTTSITVHDKGGSSATTQGSATVAQAPNRPPTVDPIANRTVTEGSKVAFRSVASDPDSGQSLTFSLDAGAPSGATIDPQTGDFSWTPANGPASATITVRATDNGSPALSAAQSFTVTVQNVAPKVSAGADFRMRMGSILSRRGSFSDPGADTWTATVDYGVGAGPTPLPLADDKSFTLTHAYAHAGTYHVTVVVTDKDGGVGSASFTVLVTSPVAAADFDGDGKADLTVYRPSTGLWATLRSSDGALKLTPFGAPNLDIPVPGDYDGDGKTDLAVYRPTTGQWIELKSTGGLKVVNLGSPGDIPLPADYDGDGKTDPAVFTPSTGQWIVLQSSTNTFRIARLGQAGDRPVPADYDGDGKADFAIYRPSTGLWIIQQSAGGTRQVTFGAPNVDKPVPADYDGDGKADIAFYRPTTGQWAVLKSTGGAKLATFGAPGTDIPAPTDFDGDGKADIAVYRKTTGLWLVMRSTTNTLKVTPFGKANTDVPVPVPIAYR